MRRYDTVKSRRACWISLDRCRSGHLFFYPHEYCPACGEKLASVKTRGEGILVTHTTLEVSPSDAPLRLGIVQGRGGAKTLCHIIGDIRGNGRDRVAVRWINGRFYALGRGCARRARLHESAICRFR